jgi:uncharacterized damage-inducible protein DinB
MQARAAAQGQVSQTALDVAVAVGQFPSYARVRSKSLGAFGVGEDSRRNCFDDLPTGLTRNRMEAIQILHRLHQYRAWCNRQLLSACRPLSAEQLHAPFEIGQGSVWRSLVHLLAADSLWLDAFEGRPDSPIPCEADFKDLQELANRWADLDRRWLDALARLDGSDLERPVLRADLRNQRFTLDRVDAHLQVCTHAAYTAAQVVNMLRRLGVAPLPNCMLVAMAYAEGRVKEVPSP